MDLNLTPIANRKHGEFILAADAAFFSQSGLFTPGITVIGENLWMTGIQSHLVVRERAALETNPHYRQLIPYVVLRQKPLQGKPKYFFYQRMKGVGEQRLAGNHSIGIGGHIESTDIKHYTTNNAIALEATIHDAMRRELIEEFDIRAIFEGDIPFEGFNGFSYGTILDDSNEVGKVHAGLIYLVDVPDNLIVTSKETELEARGFETAEKLLEDSTMEGWTVLLLKHFTIVDSVSHHPV